MIVRIIAVCFLELLDMPVSIESVISKIKKEVRVDDNGRGFASLRATARLAGISHTRIIRGGAYTGNSVGKMLAAHGIDPGALIENGVPDFVVALIVEHYAFDDEDSNEPPRSNTTARLTYRAFAAIGIRAWMQDVVGWSKPKPREKPLSTEIKYRYVSRLDDSVFLERYSEMSDAVSKPFEYESSLDGEVMLRRFGVVDFDDCALDSSNVLVVSDVELIAGRC